MKASEVIAVLKSWLGMNEKDGSFRAIIDLYNTQKPLPRNYKVKYSDEWCAATVTAAFLKAGGLSLINPECSCQKMIDGFMKMGVWIENENMVPKIGDIVFFDWQDSGSGDNTGWADHVGVVVEVGTNTFRTIEGNQNGSKVTYMDYKINQKSLRGFARPKYEADAQPSVIYYPKYSGKSNSIVDGLNTVGINSSFSFRSKIAKANNIKLYVGTAKQNTEMLNLLKSGKLKRV